MCIGAGYNDCGDLMSRGERISFKNPGNPKSKAYRLIVLLVPIIVFGVIGAVTRNISGLIFVSILGSLMYFGDWMITDHTYPRRVDVDDETIRLHYASGKIKEFPMWAVRGTSKSKNPGRTEVDAIVLIKGRWGRIGITIPICEEIERRYVKIFGRPPENAHKVGLG